MMMKEKQPPKFRHLFKGAVRDLYKSDYATTLEKTGITLGFLGIIAGSLMALSSGVSIELNDTIYSTQEWVPWAGTGAMAVGAFSIPLILMKPHQRELARRTSQIQK